MKSVQNLIFNLHDFFQNFSHFLAICFELFSFGMIFNSETTDSGPHMLDPARRARPTQQRAVATWLPRAVPLVRALRPLSGQRVARPDRLVDRAAVPTVPLSRPPWSEATDAFRRRAARHSPVDVAPRCATGPSTVSTQWHPV
jgi:hypothetical protein